MLQLSPFIGAAYSDGVSQPMSEGAVFASTSQSISDHIFKLNTAYRLATDTTAYATFSQGFRPGGSNTLPLRGGVASLPQYLSYKSDFANNYEVGLKGLALNHRLEYSLSAFWINLKNFQFDGLTPSVIAAIYNGTLAQSKGLETEATYRLSSRWTLSAGYTYTDAVAKTGAQILDLAPGALLTGGTPQLVVGTQFPSGAKLPGVSKSNITAAADYRYPIGQRSLLFHVDGNYRSSQNSTVDTTALSFLELPSVFMADAMASFDSGSNWSISLGINNVTDALGYTGVGNTQVVPNLYGRRDVARPRTFFLQLHYETQ